jgi:hypothetical protein
LLLSFDDVRLERVLLDQFADVELVLVVLLTQLSSIVLLFHHQIQIGFQTGLHPWQFALHRRVPVVLDRIVRSPVEVFRDISPPILKFPVLQKQDPFLFIAPIDLLNAGIEVVVPSFTALFALTSRQFGSNRRPPHGSVLQHHLKHFFVLFL